MIDPKNPDFENTPASPGRSNFGYKPHDPQARPVVSIITPFFNTGPIFHETARSVFRQSLQQWEWIIVDDGSNDSEALKILDEYRRMDQRIRVVVHPENRGLPAARNTGFREARTEYCLMLDSDDLLEPTAAEKWFWFLQGHPDYAFVNAYLVGFGEQQYLWRSGFNEGPVNLERNQITAIVMIRKSVHQAVGGFDESMRSGLEDWEFWVRSAAQGHWGATIPEFLFWYRRRESHADRWGDLNEDRLKAARREFRRRYPRLWKGGFPRVASPLDQGSDQVREDLPCVNLLVKDCPRLLLLTSWMVVGGAEKFNLDLISQLRRRGWEITIATTRASDHPWQHEFERLTPDVFPMDTFLDWGDYPRFLRYLIQSRQVDAVLIASSEEAYYLIPYLRYHFHYLPIIDYLHMLDPFWIDGGYPRMSLMSHSSLDLTITTSRQLKKWMEDGGAEEDRVCVSTINVDPEFWRPDLETRRETRARLGLDEYQPLILYIARLEKQKQPDVFARTMLRLSRQGSPFLALVVGDGSMRPWLEKFVRKHNLGSQVRILGELPNQEVRDIMAGGDILFLPSENEGIALTIYEAMASGLATVGADVGGQAELVTPECGFLLSPMDPEKEVEEFARVLTRLMNDPLLRRRMGQASRERVVKHFRLDQMGESMAALIEQAKTLAQTRPREAPSRETALEAAREGIKMIRANNEFIFGQSRFEQLSKDPIQLLLNPSLLISHLSTNFYFAVRKVLYPLYVKYGGANNAWLGELKSKVKSVLVRD